MPFRPRCELRRDSDGVRGRPCHRGGTEKQEGGPRRAAHPFITPAPPKPPLKQLGTSRLRTDAAADQDFAIAKKGRTVGMAPSSHQTG